MNARSKHVAFGDGGLWEADEGVWGVESGERMEGRNCIYHI
jgi:hypothetical protein